MNPNTLAPQRRLKAAVITGVAVISAATVWWFIAHPKAQSTARQITIAQYGDVFIYAPLYIAKDAGLFMKKGLDVSLVSTGGDEKTWAAVISGSASFGVADPTFVAISDKRGQPGRVIASIVNGVPFWGITFKKDLQPFTDPKQLDSLRVATFPAPSTAFTLQRQMFAQAGLRPNIRESAFGTLITMLHSGQADIALELEPNVSQAESDGAHVIYSMPQIYGDFALTGLTATPESLARDPDLARDVVCGLEMALDYARRNPDDSLKIMIKRFPEVKPETAKAALDRLVSSSTMPKSVVVQPPAWDKALRLRVDVGDITAPKPFDAYVDNTFSNGAVNTCHVK